MYIGIKPKTHTKSHNADSTMIETALMTTACAPFALGAAGIFTIGHRYKHFPSDPFRAYRQIPLRNFDSFDQFYQQRPEGSILVGVEMGGTALSAFEHPPQAIYLLGAEDYGLPKYVIEKCNLVVSLEAMIKPSYNVAVAGGIVMYDRVFGVKPQSFDERYRKVKSL